MKKFSTLITCILATWAAVVTSSGAQIAPSPSPSPSAAANDCSALAYNMMDCVGFLLVGGTETTPQGSCCSGLKTLVDFNADCVCIALNLAANLGLDIDISRAMALPSQCRVAAPSFSTCNVSGSPGGSPATTPHLAPSALPGAPKAATFDVWSAPAPAPSKSSSSSHGMRPYIFRTYLLSHILLYNHARSVIL